MRNQYLDKRCPDMLTLLGILLDSPGRVLVKSNECHGHLTAEIIGNANDPSITDIRVDHEMALQFCRGNLKPPDFNHFLSVEFKGLRLT